MSDAFLTTNYGTLDGNANNINVIICGNVVMVTVVIKITSAYTAWNGSLVKVKNVLCPRYSTVYLGPAGIGAIDPADAPHTGIQVGKSFAVGEKPHITCTFIKTS